MEKALFQSQQDVMHLTEKLVGVQSGIFPYAWLHMHLCGGLAVVCRAVERGIL